MNLETGTRFRNVVVRFDDTEFALRRSGGTQRSLFDVKDDQGPRQSSHNMTHSNLGTQSRLTSLSSTTALFDRCLSVFTCSGGRSFVDRICFPLLRTNCGNSRLHPDLHKDKRVTLNKRLKNEISNSAALITETKLIIWILLTNTIAHGRTIVYTVTPGTEGRMMAVGHRAKKFDIGKNGLNLTEDSATRLKNQFFHERSECRFLIHSTSGR